MQSEVNKKVAALFNDFATREKVVPEPFNQRQTALVKVETELATISASDVPDSQISNSLEDAKRAEAKNNESTKDKVKDPKDKNTKKCYYPKLSVIFGALAITSFVIGSVGAIVVATIVGILVGGPFGLAAGFAMSLAVFGLMAVFLYLMGLSINIEIGYPQIETD